jgi:hypothetical protein
VVKIATFAKPETVEPQKVVLQFFNWALLNFFSEAKPIHFFTHF